MPQMVASSFNTLKNIRLHWDEMHASQKNGSYNLWVIYKVGIPKSNAMVIYFESFDFFSWTCTTIYMSRVNLYKVSKQASPILFS